MQDDDRFFGILVRWRADFQCVDIVSELALVRLAVFRLAVVGFLFFVGGIMNRRGGTAARGTVARVGGVRGGVGRVGRGDEYVSKRGHEA